MRHRKVELPALVYDFSHSVVDRVSIGPRREASLDMSILVQWGAKSHYVEGVRVRFGGIDNLAEVSAFFSGDRGEGLELAWLRYAEGRKSKPHQLHVELVCERIDGRLIVSCSSLQVTGPDVRNTSS